MGLQAARRTAQARINTLTRHKHSTPNPKPQTPTHLKHLLEGRAAVGRHDGGQKLGLQAAAHVAAPSVTQMQRGKGATHRKPLPLLHNIHLWQLAT
jgi:hypothetical protein